MCGAELQRSRTVFRGSSRYRNAGVEVRQPNGEPAKLVVALSRHEFSALACDAPRRHHQIQLCETVFYVGDVRNDTVPLDQDFLCQRINSLQSADQIAWRLRYIDAATAANADSQSGLTNRAKT